jgi:hypothetical protein
MRYTLLIALCFTMVFSYCAKDPSPGPQPGDPPQLYEYKILPSATNPAINTFNNEHLVYVDTRAAAKGKLFVFLPGTTGTPGFYSLILKRAAALGYYSIGLMYPNNSDMYVASAASPDNTQFGKCRQEIFDGTDQTTGVNVNSDNCIKNRLIKLLQYLNQQYPNQGWGQFLTASGTDVNWVKIVVAGHSQGGGHAWYISKKVLVDRSIAFSSIDWNSLLNQSAAWIGTAGVSPASRLYSFNHTGDELFAYANVQQQWSDLTLTGPATNIDTEPAPYSSSHTLITTATPGINIIVPNHNITCLDPYVPKNAALAVTDNFVKAWDYLIGN